MYAEIHIEMDNAAFNDTPGTELSRILDEVVSIVINNPCLSENYHITLRDINGNKVGYFSIKT